MNETNVSIQSPHELIKCPKNKSEEDSPGLQQRAGTAAPGCQRCFSGPCAQRGFLSAPPSRLAAAEGAEESERTDQTGALREQLVKHTHLHAGLLRGSGGNLSVIVWLSGVHWETHHGGGDGGGWSVVVRDLFSHSGVVR